MTLQEMIPLARKGIKMTHTYFTPNEWLILHGNIVKFEDGVQTYLDEWTKGKNYLNDGWEVWKEN